MVASLATAARVPQMFTFMALSLATLAGAPATADANVEMILGLGPDRPTATEVVTANAVGLLHVQSLTVSEREQVEFHVYLDEHLVGEADQVDRYRFSAEIYAVSLNRKGEVKHRELVSRPRILALEGQSARIVQGQSAPSGELMIALTLTPHAAEVSAVERPSVGE